MGPRELSEDDKRWHYDSASRSNRSSRRTSGGPDTIQEHSSTSLSAPQRPHATGEEADITNSIRREEPSNVAEAPPRSPPARRSTLVIGAVRVPGPNPRGVSINTVIVGESQRDHLVDAVPVDQEEEERRIADRVEAQRQDVPVARAVKQTPWYLRRGFLVAVVLMLGAVAVLVVVTIMMRNRQQPSPPASSPFRATPITLVLQLDSSPNETGWTLECDEEAIETVKPGTYSFLSSYLPVVGMRPNFRVEYETMVAIGSECMLTIMDTGNDGLDGGFYEVYYGNGVGQQQTRITSGTVLTGSSTIAFAVDSPPIVTEPTNSTTAAQTNCSVCPDGSAPTFPETLVEEWGQTCQEVNAAVSRLSFDSEECRRVHDTAAQECGCSDFCTTLCADGTSEPTNDDSFVFVKDGRDVTCADFQSEIASSKSNSIEQCRSANFLGEEVCGCPPTDAFCRICQDDRVPPPEFLEKEILPGANCRDITGLAYKLRETDPTFFEICPAFVSIGTYCGCEQPSDGLEFCRLCDDNKGLPEPARLVNSTILNQTTTCFHVEFAANVDGDKTLECEDYRDDVATRCCFEGGQT